MKLRILPKPKLRCEFEADAVASWLRESATELLGAGSVIESGRVYYPSAVPF